MANEPSAPDNARVAFDYYVSQGLSPVQAAGIVGNLQGESGQGLNPNAINRGDGRDGSDSVGVGQWNSTRAQALRDFAAAKGANWNDLNTQLEFLHTELKGPEKAAYSKLMAAQTPEEAGQAMLAFERPKDWNKPGAHPERGQYAAKVFAAYGGGQPAAPVGPPGGLLAQPAQPGMPLAITPPTAGLFAPPQQPQQPQQQAQAAAPFEPTPPMQMQPITMPQRRSPDLTKLRAAFKAPALLRG